MMSKCRVVSISWYCILASGVVLIFEQEPWTVSCSPNSVFRIFLVTFSWSANVEDMKSPSDPLSMSAWAGCPLILT